MMKHEFRCCVWVCAWKEGRYGNIGVLALSEMMESYKNSVDNFNHYNHTKYDDDVHWKISTSDVRGSCQADLMLGVINCPKLPPELSRLTAVTANHHLSNTLHTVISIIKSPPLSLSVIRRSRTRDFQQIKIVNQLSTRLKFCVTDKHYSLPFPELQECHSLISQQI